MGLLTMPYAIKNTLWCGLLFLISGHFLLWVGLKLDLEYYLKLLLTTTVCFCLLVLLTMFCCFCICILCLDFLMVIVSSQDNHSQLVLVSFSSLAVHVANWVQLWRSSLCTLYAEMCFTFSSPLPHPRWAFSTAPCHGAGVKASCAEVLLFRSNLHLLKLCLCRGALCDHKKKKLGGKTQTAELMCLTSKLPVQ